MLTSFGALFARQPVLPPATATAGAGTRAMAPASPTPEDDKLWEEDTLSAEHTRSALVDEASSTASEAALEEFASEEGGRELKAEDGPRPRPMVNMAEVDNGPPWPARPRQPSDPDSEPEADLEAPWTERPWQSLDPTERVRRAVERAQAAMLRELGAEQGWAGAWHQAAAAWWSQPDAKEAAEEFALSGVETPPESPHSSFAAKEGRRAAQGRSARHRTPDLPETF
mmetsp:Transcript_96459/g.281911  ORF Transcript_96459/g.281911 Transcript_96459/m.281911 type:complete len:227 (+) Transcript_96459:84-764(+)